MANVKITEEMVRESLELLKKIREKCTKGTPEPYYKIFEGYPLMYLNYMLSTMVRHKMISLLYGRKPTHSPVYVWTYTKELEPKIARIILQDVIETKQAKSKRYYDNTKKKEKEEKKEKEVEVEAAPIKTEPEDTSIKVDSLEERRTVKVILELEIQVKIKYV